MGHALSERLPLSSPSPADPCMARPPLDRFALLGMAANQGQSALERASPVSPWHNNPAPLPAAITQKISLPRCACVHSSVFNFSHLAFRHRTAKFQPSIRR